VQFAFVVPKKNFPLAKDRNLLKRRMRESVRLHKHTLYEVLNTKNKQLVLAFVFHSKKITDYATIVNAVVQLQQKIVQVV